MDQHAALASPSPLAASPRFVGLLLACPLLALMLWQWQQLSQAIGLLEPEPSRALATCVPLTPVQLESERLCLGSPLLLLSPLQITNPTPAPTNAHRVGSDTLSLSRSLQRQPPLLSRASWWHGCDRTRATHRRGRKRRSG
ncbi:hypothetical protein [Cyanobium sp. ATX-6F1]|uniref:hypothetical protein n=1 Tax=Cyanobium sp. ATX-6F1 TaxID=3137388 RepID=UPI0039BDF727